MEVGDLVMVRLKDKKGKSIFVPGLIVTCVQQDKPPTFEILVSGVKRTVTHRDIGPFDLFE